MVNGEVGADGDAVGSFLREFWIEEKNVNVLGHGGYGHGNVCDFWIRRCGLARSVGCAWCGPGVV
jgi:hypothetical protein